MHQRGWAPGMLVTRYRAWPTCVGAGQKAPEAFFRTTKLTSYLIHLKWRREDLDNEQSVWG